MAKFIPHTSSFACDDIARESLLKTFGQTSTKNAHSKLVNLLLIPLAERVMRSGKIAHGQIRTISNWFIAQLSKEPTIVSASVEHRSSKLSSNEKSYVSYVMAVGDGDWLDFVACEIVITRTCIELQSTDIDFRVHRHALSRFIQREIKPPEEIITSVAEAIKFGSLTGNLMLCASKHHECAIPLGNGLLLGKVVTINSSQQPAEVTRIRIEKNVPPTETTVARPDHLVKGFRGVLELLTYVGDRQLTKNREKLRDALVGFQNQNKEALDIMFMAHYYENAAIRADTNHARNIINQSTNDLERFLQGHLWDSFGKSVGTGPNGRSDFHG